MAKRRRQRITLVDSAHPEPDVAPGLRAFADVLTAPPTPKLVRDNTSRREAMPWLYEWCALGVIGCTGGQACREHPNALELASRPELSGDQLAALVDALRSTSSRRSLRLFCALAAHPRLDGRHLEALAQEVHTVAKQPSGRAESEPMALALLDRPGLPARALLALASCAYPTPLAVLALCEYPGLPERTKMVAAHALTRPMGAPNARAALAAFGGDKARIAVAFGMLNQDYDAARLGRLAGVALSRFTHARPAAVEMIESLASEWSGTIEELVATAALLIGRKRR